MGRAWSLALMCLAFLAASSSAAERRVIIRFKSGTTLAAREKVLQELNAKPLGSIISNGNSDEEFVAVVAQLPGETGAVRKTSQGHDLGQEARIQALAAQGIAVEEDFRIKWIEGGAAGYAGVAFPNPSLKELGLPKFERPRLGREVSRMAFRGELPWGVARLKAQAAWDKTEGAGVRVAIVDTGVDWYHSDLQGRVDGGFSAISDSEKPESYLDDNGHGTHVAGTIGAARDGRGVVGVAPKARLYAVKVLDAEGSGTLSDVIKGVIWCANNGMHVANMSLGAPFPSDSMEQAVKYAKARGVVIVAAAGNSGKPESGSSVGYPAAYPETIAVAASDWDNQIADFSSRGLEVKFIAPGKSILSTIIGDDLVPMSGTSMAAPHVTGLAALVVSMGYRGLDGPDGVLGQLRRAARPLPGLQATDQGFGMVDADRLIR
ncbi:MAG: S8 family peptidase [Elusimicrobia bacterium]|nr:S8 family peptidase [Elusimicrobiota bacterium]